MPLPVLLGIDPTKTTVAFDGTDFHHIKPEDLRRSITLTIWWLSTAQ